MACGATLKRSLQFDPLHSPQSAISPKRRRCLPMTVSPSTPPTKLHQMKSPFEEVTPSISSEEIAAKLSAEIKRMHRRKQLHYPMSSSPPAPASPSGSSSQESFSNVQSSQSTPNIFGGASPSKKDVPLFTFRQVTLMCDRMIKEHEGNVREEYDKVLSCKMAEQYEAFLKFNHDQIQKRFNETAASYVS
ncbi:unnamed protein product [Owenia fusiformis]|uniref:Uncharacterized protein n=1 Tax=Owenia fusiformis TaxID=6347 RepID=A0A8J1TAC4_OWEFU|nr:unnamed protein product [Owenia fusiformis]